MTRRFQSTRPVWGATGLVFRDNVPFGVSIHAPRVGRDFLYTLVYTLSYVSIHAPRVGRDHIHEVNEFDLLVSIHAPRVGRDGPCSCTNVFPPVFQSTRPVWGATSA